MAANVGVLGRAQVEVKADTKKLKTGLKGAENSVKTSTQKMSAAFKMLGTAVVAMGLARIVKDVTAAFKVQETAVRNIQVAIEQQGGSWARLRKEVLKTASDLQGKTIYGDEETLAAMTAAINAGGDYATVLKNVSLMQDIAAASNKDLVKVGEAFGAAMVGNTEILGRYYRKILTIESAERDWVTVQKMLNENLGGTAAKQAKTYTGQLQQMSNAWGDLKEEAGGFILKMTSPAVKGLLKIFNKLNDASKTINQSFYNINKNLAKMNVAQTYAEIKDLKVKIARITDDEGKAFRGYGMMLKQYIIQLGILETRLKYPEAVIPVIKPPKPDKEDMFPELSAEETKVQDHNAYMRLLAAEAAQKEIDLAKETAQKLADIAKVKLAEAQARAEKFANIMTSTFMNWAQAGELTFKKFGEHFKAMIASMIADALVFAAVMALIPGGGGIAGFGATFMKRILGEEHGDVFNQGNVVPFASGGIVTMPTVFPMSNGMGMMGEAGPEAVMPLTRTQSGDLGVKAETANISLTALMDGEEIASYIQRREEFDARRGF